VGTWIYLAAVASPPAIVRLRYMSFVVLRSFITKEEALYPQMDFI